MASILVEEKDVLQAKLTIQVGIVVHKTIHSTIYHFLTSNVLRETSGLLAAHALLTRVVRVLNGEHVKQISEEISCTSIQPAIRVQKWHARSLGHLLLVDVDSLIIFEVKLCQGLAIIQIGDCLLATEARYSKSPRVWNSNCFPGAIKLLLQGELTANSLLKLVDCRRGV